MNVYEIIGIILTVLVIRLLINRSKKNNNSKSESKSNYVQIKQQKSSKEDFSEEKSKDNDIETSSSTSGTNNLHSDYIKYLYEHPQTLVEFEFSNRTKTTVNVWIELACVEVDLDDITEYKIISHDRSFRIEFDENSKVTFYLQYSFGFKLFKRPISKDAKNELEWTLDYDCSDIN